MALQYSPDGFHVAFSGGKDSQVIHELCRMAHVKFKAYFYQTSVYPNQLPWCCMVKTGENHVPAHPAKEDVAPPESPVLLRGYKGA